MEPASVVGRTVPATVLDAHTIATRFENNGDSAAGRDETSGPDMQDRVLCEGRNESYAGTGW